MKLTSKSLAVIVVTVLFGSILFTTAMNWWQTVSTKTPAVFKDGEAAGQYNPADIRGSYTFADIEKSFGVPAQTLAEAFGMPAGTDAAAIQVKSLEAAALDPDFEIGTASVRLFVAFYTGLPYDLSVEAWVLPAGAKILREHGLLTAERETFLAAHTAGEVAAAPAPVITPTAVTPAPTPEHAVGSGSGEGSPTDRTVRGKTTFAEILGWGVTGDALRGALNGDLPASNLAVKDYVEQKGLDMTSVRAALQALVDAAK